MKTTVVNLHKEKYDVYIGRPGRGIPGPLGNPIMVNRECVICGGKHSDPGSTIPCFREYFTAMLDDPEYKKLVESCRGKRIGCFCKPKPCHGDVIAEYLNRDHE